MRRKLFMILSLGALLGGCGGGGQTANTSPASRPAQIKQVACDDGGSGGVLIDGVCL